MKIPSTTVTHSAYLIAFRKLETMKMGPRVVHIRLIIERRR